MVDRRRTPSKSTQPAEPDLVDRIFDYIFSDPALSDAVQRIADAGSSIQSLKASVRSEFRGEECYIANRPATERERVVAQVLSLFNGRNAGEVARRLSIGRATVYRIIKQAAQEKSSQFSGK